MNKHTGKAASGTLVGIIAAGAIIVAVAAILHFDVTGQSGNRLSADFQYDLGAFARTDPNLILYEETSAPIPTGFQNSTCIASAPNGNLYVGGDNAIRIFSLTGEQLGDITVEDTPTTLTLAHDGTIYAGLKDHIEIFDKQGNLLASWPKIDDAVLTSLALSRDNLFAADAGNRVVWRCDKTGEIVGEIGHKDPRRNISGFIIPSPYFDIAMAGDGLLRVADTGRHRIEAWTPRGDLEIWWGKPSPGIEDFCGCCNPANFTMLDDDSFITCEKGLVRVKLYNPDGAFLGVVAGHETFGIDPTSQPAAAFDVAVDKNGRVFVLDTVRNTVRTFTKKEDTP